MRTRFSGLAAFQQQDSEPQVRFSKVWGLLQSQTILRGGGFHAASGKLQFGQIHSGVRTGWIKTGGGFEFDARLAVVLLEDQQEAIVAMCLRRAWIKRKRFDEVILRLP